MGNGAMEKTKLVKFEPRQWVLEKVHLYIDSLDLFFEEYSQAVPLLLRALKKPIKN